MAALLAMGCLFCSAISGCGNDDASGSDFALPDSGMDVSTSTATDGAAADVGATADIGTGADSAALVDTAKADVGTPDAGPPNTPPEFAAITALILDQGASTTLDLNPLLSDAEDAKDKLVLSWSAKKVALQDPGTHVLHVVAPTTWFGQELIELTATDSAGGTAMQVLTVTVNEVVVEPPKPLDTCGKVIFSYAAGKGDHEVLLSGSFNGWADKPDTADKLTDPGGTGIWKVEKTLKAGVYQYKFLVDGQWKADPDNANQTPDGFGGHNSVIEVAKCDP